MINISIQKGLKELFREWAGVYPEAIELLPGSGSARRYYRMRSGSKTALGAYNRDAAENDAFFAFTDHFLKSGLPVPEIYSIDHDLFIYLLEDLGDETLFSYITTLRQQDTDEEAVKNMYQKDIILKIYPS